AGVQKAGTTALAGYLARHPEIQMSCVKEIHYFDCEDIDWDNPDREPLHRHFDWSVQGVMRGEATPIYTYWPSALPRLKRYNPSARIIVSLRHPVFRAWSGWRMETRRGAETFSFADAVSNPGRERVKSAPGGVHRIYSYVERSFYADQVQRLLDLFRRDQVHFLRTDTLWQDPASTLTAVEAFLGVRPHLAGTVEREYIVAVDSSALGAIPDDVRLAIDAMFRDDITKTADLTGLDLSDWLVPDYREPMDSTRLNSS